MVARWQRFVYKTLMGEPVAGVCVWREKKKKKKRFLSPPKKRVSNNIVWTSRVRETVVKVNDLSPIHGHIYVYCTVHKTVRHDTTRRSDANENFYLQPKNIADKFVEIFGWAVVTSN